MFILSPFIFYIQSIEPFNFVFESFDEIPKQKIKLFTTTYLQLEHQLKRNLIDQNNVSVIVMINISIIKAYNHTGLTVCGAFALTKVTYLCVAYAEGNYIMIGVGLEDSLRSLLLPFLMGN